MAKPAFSCVGYEPGKSGLKPNCGNCKQYNGKTCLVKAVLNELYEDSPKYRAMDRMMRGNKGVRL